jgi:V/A-type H+-transporting ATPase subunit D
MARIKHTKTELKGQRDALRRFERYLPTLQLKKQLLQVEVWRVGSRIEEKEAEERAIRRQIEAWIRLFAEPVDFTAYLKLVEIRQTVGNIAGVGIPVLQEILFAKSVPDLFATAPWVDDGLRVLEQLLRRRIERRILEEERRLLAEELRVTSQRVNLFEKVKIPECRENIRVIRIFLGDLQTADVARAKLAKRRMAEAETAA